MMHDDAATEYLELLLDLQFEVLWAHGSWGVNHAEFIFVQTARVVTEYPSLRQPFLSMVERCMVASIVLDGATKSRPPGFVPHEFIEFFAHFSRWPEFNDLAQRMSLLPQDVWQSNLLTTWSGSIRDALSNEWQDREFYESFSAASGA